MHFTDEDLQAVQQCELFVDAPQTVCVALSDARCFSGDYAPGEMLYSEHSFERALGVIVHGTCDVIKRTPTGRSIAINRLGPGALFGAAALFGEEKDYEVCLLVRTALRAVFFPEAQLTELFTADSRLSLSYIRYLSSRIHFLNRRIATLAEGSAEEKLCTFLLSAAVPDGQGGGTFTPPSATRLASTLSVSRATLYRALDALEGLGVLSRNGREIRIPDLSRLDQSGE